MTFFCKVEHILITLNLSLIIYTFKYRFTFQLLCTSSYSTRIRVPPSGQLGSVRLMHIQLVVQCLKPDGLCCFFFLNQLIVTNLHPPTSRSICASGWACRTQSAAGRTALWFARSSSCASTASATGTPVKLSPPKTARWDQVLTVNILFALKGGFFAYCRLH